MPNIPLTTKHPYRYGDRVPWIKPWHNSCIQAPFTCKESAVWWATTQLKEVSKPYGLVWNNIKRTFRGRITTCFNATEVADPGATVNPSSSGKGYVPRSCIDTRIPASGARAEMYSLCWILNSKVSPTKPKWNCNVILQYKLIEYTCSWI